MTEIIHDIATIKKLCKNQEDVGLVTTMGNLHVGHARLLERSRLENKLSILSIFINPTQFNDSNDFLRYPRSLEQDQQIAAKNQVDYIFVPTESEMYADQYHYKISETEMTKIMEGKFRPGHFDGMLTIVMKLLQIVQPTRVYFGEKDFQQYQLVQGMAKAFFLDTEVIPCQTVRESSGLAYSSRNNLLTPEQKQQAPLFYQALTQSADCQKAAQQLRQLGFEVEYIEDHANRRYGAVYLGKVRLIDNVPL